MFAYVALLSHVLTIFAYDLLLFINQCVMQMSDFKKVVNYIYEGLYYCFFRFRSNFCVRRTACVHDGTVPVCFLCADDQEWELVDCVNV